MTEQHQPETVGILGCGYMGTVAGAAFARRGFPVIGHDIDEARIQKLGQGEIPFHEPGLQELIRESLAAGRLAFTGDHRRRQSGSDAGRPHTGR